jgi:tetratricopeptide (TPR) repeat protein
MPPKSRQRQIRKTEPSSDNHSLPGSTWPPDWPRHPVFLAGLLILLAMAAYQPVWHAGYIWDDDSWTTKLFPHLGNPSGLLTIWLHPTVLQQYYPVTASTFWLDYKLWGFNPMPYHVENVLGHGLSAVLFWRWLRRLKVPGAWLAGAILAVHPLLVESVAWITERKNVLSLLFYLGALLAYGQYTRFWDMEPAGVDGQSVHTPGWRAYGLAGILFIFALLSKITAFSFPAVVLLICWWKRGRLRWRADVLPALPFFAVSIGLGLFTSWLEKHHVGANGRDWALTFPERCLVAGRALWFYAGKIFWPAHLCFLYPRWQLNAASPAQWLYPAAALAVLLALWLGRKRIGRGPATAAFIFTGTLFPVLGFMNAYYMLFSFVCDHLAYISSLALIAPAAALIARWWERWRAQGAVFALAPVALSLLAVLGFLTWKQTRIYANETTLWRDTLAKNPSCWMAHHSLGVQLSAQGRIGEALEHYRAAAALYPSGDLEQSDLGTALLQEGLYSEAIEHLEAALAMNPKLFEAHNSLALAYANSGNPDQAVAHFRKALQIQPDALGVFMNLGNVLQHQGRLDEAIENYREASKRFPSEVDPLRRLAGLLKERQQFPQAAEVCRQALQIAPKNADLLLDLGNIYFANTNYEASADCYRKAIQVGPANAGLHYNLGIVQGLQGRTEAERQELRESLRLNPDFLPAKQELQFLDANQTDAAGANK